MVGNGRVLLCAQRLYYRRDQLDFPPPNGLNHNLSLNKTGAHNTEERFRATIYLQAFIPIYTNEFSLCFFYDKLGIVYFCTFLGVSENNC